MTSKAKESKQPAVELNSMRQERNLSLLEKTKKRDRYLNSCLGIYPDIKTGEEKISFNY